MTLYKPGDVVLVLFPFTDLESFKKRPALVLSTEAYQRKHKDVIILALTSQSQPSRENQIHWQRAGLPKPTWLKPVVATISLNLISRQLGHLDRSDWGKVTKELYTSIDQSFLDKEG